MEKNPVPLTLPSNKERTPTLRRTSMLNPSGRMLLAILILTLIPSAAAANPDPVMEFIFAADSVNTAAGTRGLAEWLPGQPDLSGAAAARLIDIGVQVGDAGDSDGEAGNIALVEALAEAHSGANPDSFLPTLLDEYRSWDIGIRRERADARATEDAAWAGVGAAPDSSLTALLAADEVYARIGDSHSRARVHGRIGAAHWYLGDAAGVQAGYEEALRRRREVQDRMLEGATLNGLGSFNYRLVGDLEAALDWYDQAVTLRRAIGDTAGLATSLTYKANVQTELGQLVEARTLYEEARPVLARLGDAAREVENVYGTATLYASMGRTADAMALFTEGADLCATDPECGYGPLLLVERALAEQRVGLTRESLTTLDRAEALLAARPDPSTATRVWQLRSAASRQLGDQDAARDQMLRSLELARESGDPALQCDGAILLSALYLELGAKGRARSTAEEALGIADGIEDPTLQRSARNMIARVDVAEGRGADAEVRCTEALKLSQELGDQTLIVADLLARGAARSLDRRPEQAREDLRQAEAISREAGIESARWLILLNLADTFEETAPDSAAWYYDAALAALEREGRNFGGEALNTGYLFADRGRAYEEITRYYAGRHREDPKGEWDARAFKTAERSRARGLLDLLNDSFALDAGPEALALIDSLYQIDTSTPEGRADRERIEARLAVLRAERRSGSAGTAIEPVNLLEFRKKKPTQALVLQYAVGDSATILFAIDNKNTVLHELPGRAELRRRVTAFRDAIAQPGQADDVLLSEGRALYETLLGPAHDRIGRRKHLVIVPDDVLFELPFEALLSDEPLEGAAWSDQPFFARDHRPVYAPSSTVYLRLREQKAGRFHQSLLALGGIDYSGFAPELEPLPFTRAEVEGIPHKLKEDERTLLLGPDASELRLRMATSIMSSRVVHLATHGLIDPAEPMRSSVVLAPEGDDDGYLHSLEILAMELDRPMIVLSACESALGRLERGEGVVGLTRSFLAAGARGVVASLWPVSDESTATLMSEFYSALWKKYSAAESLRQARAALLESEEWSHPYYWAPFIAIGTEKTPW
jgi:CHAT domain-containing protein